MPQTPEERKAKQAAYNKEYYAANQEELAAKARRKRAENPEKHKAANKKYRAANKEERAAYGKKWNAKNKEKRAALNREWNAKSKAENPYWGRNNLYNIDFEEMLAKQGGECLICKTTSPEGQGDGWHVDHDHDCCKGRGSCGDCVRGILCGHCNKGLGHFKDNLEFLEQAQHYLLKETDVIGIWRIC